MFSHFDRMQIGQYFSFSPKHLQRYCDEFIYRYNSRKMKDGDRWNNAMSKINGRLSYKMLVNGEKYPQKTGRKAQKDEQAQGE